MKSNSELYLEQYKDIYDNKIILDDKLATDNNLDLFYNEIKNCTKCSLSKSRTKLVFGIGNPNADIVLVGEAPGKNEDLQGEPFVGRGGKLLDKILEAINLNRKKVFILNVLKCRPPENRDPKPQEILECEPYLKKHIGGLTYTLQCSGEDRQNLLCKEQSKLLISLSSRNQFF